jgi:plastocyanin
MIRRYLSVLVFIFALSALVSCGSKEVILKVDMVEFKFDPDTIEAPAGDEVTVNLSNSGTLEHEMVIMVFGSEATIPFDAGDEPNIYWEHELEPGDRETATFTAPSEAGVYQVVCGIPAHLEQGMVGQLIVK